MRLLKFFNLLIADKEELGENIRQVYYRNLAKKKGLDEVEIEEFVNLDNICVNLESFKRTKGNVSYLELLYICLLTKGRLNPGENFLEIGTFNGNTVFNVSLNMPESSMCYTIDLPLQESSPSVLTSKGDLGFIRSKHRYNGKHFRRKNVQQFYADSTKFDFSKLAFNAAFVDGGHHYSAVMSDTRNVLRCIRRPGFVLWHDYHGYNDVSKVIHELIAQSKCKIVRLKNTRLCLLILN